MNFDNVLGYTEEKAELAKIADILKKTEKYHALGVETKQILIENREFLDKLAKALLEKKTLLRSDIAAIRAACTVKGGQAA